MIRIFLYLALFCNLALASVQTFHIEAYSRTHPDSGKSFRPFSEYSGGIFFGKIWYRVPLGIPSDVASYCIKPGKPVNHAWYYLNEGKIVEVDANDFSFSRLDKQDAGHCAPRSAFPDTLMIALESHRNPPSYFLGQSFKDQESAQFHKVFWPLIYFAFSISMILMNLMLWAYFKFRLFLFYVFFLSCFTYLGFVYSGTIYLFDFPISPKVYCSLAFTGFVTLFFLSLFTTHFFDLHKKSRWYLFLLFAPLFYPLQAGVLNLFGVEGTVYYGTPYFVFHISINILIAFIMWRQKEPWALYYIFSWGLYCLGIACILLGRKFPDSAFLSSYAPTIFHMFELVAFTLLISSRVLDQIRNQKNVARFAGEYRTLLLHQISHGLTRTSQYFQNIVPHLIQNHQLNTEDQEFLKQITRVYKNWININYITQNKNLPKTTTKSPYLFLVETIQQYRLLYPMTQVQLFNKWDGLENDRFHPLIELVLLNLIDNAFRFGKDKPIVVQAVFQSKQDKVYFNIENKNQTHFKLPDTHKDPQDMLSANFKRQEGMGLGLLNVRRMVAETGGSLSLDPTELGSRIQVSWKYSEIKIFTL